MKASLLSVLDLRCLGSVVRVEVVHCDLDVVALGAPHRLRGPSEDVVVHLDLQHGLEHSGLGVGGALALETHLHQASVIPF